MGRYARILLSLALLAVAYDLMGGFGPDGVVPPVEPVVAETTTLASFGPSPLQDLPDSVMGPAEMPPEPVVAPVPDDPWETLTIGRGESFYVALQKAGLSHETIMALVKACKPHTNLRRVKRGDRFELARNEDGALLGLRFELDAEHFLVAQPDAEGIKAEIGSYPVERVVKGVRGTVDTNLFDALREQGADPHLASQLADILGWDIDFFRDLRRGDAFVVVYEEFVHEGRKVRDGQILAAHFTNQGERHEAYLFENELELPAYYDEAGQSLEKQFLRAPLKFSHISSGFSRRRLHPVLKRYRPHYGVDYAAPTGTPILATADGVVTKREYRKGNGNFVTLQHGPVYESYYLHMVRFPRGLKVGDKVKQGDVIGYVGQTGWATGPHLDYRIKKNGQWVDPRKLKLPPAEPVGADRMALYTERRDELIALLETVPDDQRTVVMTPTPSPGHGPEPILR